MNNLALPDEKIVGTLNDFAMTVNGQTLEIGESISCDSDEGEIQTIFQTVENTSTVSATSIYGTPFSVPGTPDVALFIAIKSAP